MKYQEWIDDELQGYEYAGVVSDVDQQTINEGLNGEGTICDDCASKMRYEGWMNDRGSYRALSICTNDGCQNCWEF